MKRGTIEHPKMKRLARMLNCEHLLAVGIMESLWHWTAKYAPEGDIGKHSDEDIADGIGYRGDVSRLVATLADCGWLDRCERHRLIVHDWHQHADDAVKKAAERNKISLITAAIRPVATCPDSVATCPDKNCLPEPEPEPLPLPLPEPDSAADAAAPAGLLAFVECWNANAPEAKRVRAIGKVLRAAWKKTENRELRECFADLEHLATAIRNATWARSQPWFTAESMFTKDKDKIQWKVRKLLNGEYNGRVNGKPQLQTEGCKHDSRTEIKNDL